MEASAIYGEKYPSKVAAQFRNRDDARRAADAVMRGAAVGGEQVQVVAPADSAIDHKLEPETRGIERTLVRSHLTLGISGALTGIVIALFLIGSGSAMFNSNVGYTLGLGIGFGAVAGLLLGGLISLRPDHDPMLAWVRDASDRGRWFVLVHTRDHAEERRVRELLQTMSRKVKTTF